MSGKRAGEGKGRERHNKRVKANGANKPRSIDYTMVEIPKGGGGHKQNVVSELLRIRRKAFRLGGGL